MAAMGGPSRLADAVWLEVPPEGEEGEEALGWAEDVVTLPFTAVAGEEEDFEREDGDLDEEDEDPLLGEEAGETEELELDGSEGSEELLPEDVDPEDADPEEVESEEVDPEGAEPDEVEPEIEPEEVDPDEVDPDVDPEDDPVELPPAFATSSTISDSWTGRSWLSSDTSDM